MSSSTPKRILSLLLGLGLALPRPAWASPEFGRRTLRALEPRENPRTRGSIAVGLEEGPSGAVWSPASREKGWVAYRKARDIFEAKDPLTDFVDSKQALDLNYLVAAFRSGSSGKSNIGPSGPRLARVLEVFSVAGDRLRRYKAGERSLETLPRLARRIVAASWRVGNKTAFPTISRQELKVFVDRFWSREDKGIPFGARELLARRIGKRQDSKLVFPLHAIPTPDEFEQAFLDLKATIRDEGLVPRGRTLQDRAPEQAAKKLQQKYSSERIGRLRAEWVEASRAALGRLIQQAPKGSLQPIEETSLQIQDSAKGMPVTNEPGLNLLKVSDRLKRDRIGMDFKPGPSGGITLQILNATVNNPPTVQQRIERLKNFPTPEQARQIFTPPSAGLEESAESLAEELKRRGGFGFIDPLQTEYPVGANWTMIARIVATVSDKGLIPKINLPLGSDAFNLRVLKEFRRLRPEEPAGVALYEPGQVGAAVEAAGAEHLAVSAPAGVIARVVEEVNKAGGTGKVLVIAKVRNRADVEQAEQAGARGIEVEPAEAAGHPLADTVALLDWIAAEKKGKFLIWGSAGGVNESNARELVSRGYIGFSVGPQSLESKLRWFTAARGSTAAGLEEMEAVFRGVEETAAGRRVLAVDAAEVSRRVGLEEFLARLPRGVKTMVLGAGSIAGLELAARGRVRYVGSDQPVDWAAALAGLEEDRITFVGKRAAGELLSRILPPSMEVSVLGPGSGLEEILLSLGLPPAFLGEINASGVEERLARERAA